MSFVNLLVERSDGIGRLAYNRPPRNGFDWTMLREVPAALDELIAAADVRVIVVATAIGRWFSAGADLAVFRGMTQDDIVQWVTICHGIVRTMRASPKPLLAAISGTAVGGGLEIALHCDVRFAAHDAKLGQPEVNIAFIPPIGGTQALARLLGPSRAMRFLYDGALVSADEARAIGLVDEVVPAGELDARVRSSALALAAKPANTLAAIRRCVLDGLELRMDEGLRIEHKAAVALGGHRNFNEGVAAFLDKRPPRWE